MVLRQKRDTKLIIHVSSSSQALETRFEEAGQNRQQKDGHTNETDRHTPGMLETQSARCFKSIELGDKYTAAEGDH